MGVEELSVEVERSASDVATTLRSLADGFDAGTTLSVTAGEETASLSLPDALTLEVEIEREDDEVELEVELGWTDPTGSTADPGEKSDDGEATTVSIDPAAEPSRSDSSRDHAEFQLFEDRAGEWRWRLVHRNGNVIADSGEGYTSKRNAEKGLRSVMRNAPGANVTELEESD